MKNFGEKICIYLYEKLRNILRIDVNYFGNIFVVDYLSNII